MNARAVGWKGIIEEYRSVLGFGDVTPITLLEGNTPLLYAPSLSERVQAHVYLKIEGANPTGSFKDRGMTAAMSMAVRDGAQRVMCASTGNTSASAAAYAAVAKLPCFVLIPEGHIALGKLSQAMIFGARVVQIQGNFDEALAIVRELGKEPEVAIVNSINPHRITGQMSGAFEVVDVLGAAPDMQFMPVGNAGNITAYWRGYCAAKKDGRSASSPRMHGVQAAGAAPFLRGHPIDAPETIATAIRIGKPASWDGAHAAVRESYGAFHEVTDEEILHAYQYLAQHEGVFCEPASAASVAGLLKVVASPSASSAVSAASGAKDELDELEGRTIVCVLTGNGLKDSDRAAAVSPKPAIVEPTLSAIRRVLDA